MIAHNIGALVISLMAGAESPLPPPPPTGPAAAPAQEAAVKRTSIRAMILSGGFDYGELAAEVSHPFNDWIGVEASVGGVGFARAPGHGLDIMALGRFGHFGRLHAVSMGFGPSLLLSETFGPVPFFNVDLEYEVRLPHGLSMAMGI